MNGKTQVNTKYLALLLAAIVFVFFSGCGAIHHGDTHLEAPCEDGFELLILHVNDTHSHLEPSRTSLSLGGEKTYLDVGGFPRLASKIDELRATGINSLLLHAGDAITGTLYNIRYEGKAEIDFMNMMKFDAMVTGNHEFDKGPAWLADFIVSADFPLIAANMDASKDVYLRGLINPYVIKEMDGNKVGIIGLVAPETAEFSNPGDAILFADDKMTAEQMVRELEDRGVNKIILLTHLGYERDLELAESVEGIDIIVGGHTHSLLGDFSALGLASEGAYPTKATSPAGHAVCVVQAFEEAKVLGALKVEFDKNGFIAECSGNPILLTGDAFRQKNGEGCKVEVDQTKKEEILGFIREMPVIEVVEEEAEALEKLARYRKGLEEFRRQRIATVGDNLWHVRVPATAHPLSGEAMEGGSYLAPMVAEAMLWKANSVGMNAQMALQNAGGVRTDLEQGVLTVGKLYEVFPFGNTLILLELTGSEIKAVLEAAVTRAANPDQDGAFPYLGGARYTADMTQPEGKRIISIELKNAGGEWECPDNNAVYRVITNSFIAGGGDGYRIMKNASGYRYDTGFIDAEIFMEYALKFDPLHRLESKGITYIAEK